MSNNTFSFAQESTTGLFSYESKVRYPDFVSLLCNSAAVSSIGRTPDKFAWYIGLNTKELFAPDDMFEALFCLVQNTFLFVNNVEVAFGYRGERSWRIEVRIYDRDIVYLR